MDISYLCENLIMIWAQVELGFCRAVVIERFWLVRGALVSFVSLRDGEEKRGACFTRDSSAVARLSSLVLDVKELLDEGKRSKRAELSTEIN